MWIFIALSRIAVGGGGHGATIIWQSIPIDSDAVIHAGSSGNQLVKKTRDVGKKILYVFPCAFGIVSEKLLDDFFVHWFSTNLVCRMIEPQIFLESMVLINTELIWYLSWRVIIDLTLSFLLVGAQKKIDKIINTYCYSPNLLLWHEQCYHFINVSIPMQICLTSV